MAKINFWCISCSSDCKLDTRKLFIHGGEGKTIKITWLPDTKGEAEKRVLECQEKNQCAQCDYEIHPVTIPRTKRTFLQMSRCPDKKKEELI